MDPILIDPCALRVCDAMSQNENLHCVQSANQICVELSDLFKNSLSCCQAFYNQLPRLHAVCYAVFDK